MRCPRETRRASLNANQRALHVRDASRRYIRRRDAGQCLPRRTSRSAHNTRTRTSYILSFLYIVRNDALRAIPLEGRRRPQGSTAPQHRFRVLVPEARRSP